MGHFWMPSVDGSLFSSSTSSSTSTSTDVAPSCGPSYSPCPVTYPCCNLQRQAPTETEPATHLPFSFAPVPFLHGMVVDGTCHKTTLQACPIALGCQPAFSHPIDASSSSSSASEATPLAVNSCFPLPVCRSFKEKFKSNQPNKRGQHQALIAKEAFLGDPDQAHWTSDFDHVVDDHAFVDTKGKKLVLKAKRDKVKTKSGGGFGATVSSTRWNRYGTFATQFKAGSTGPGIVTAFILSNPALGEEISFQITGRDPKTVLTEYYKHSTESLESVKDGQDNAGGKGGWMSASVQGLHWPHLPSVLSIESITTRGRKIKDLLLHKIHDDDNGTSAGKSGENIEGSTIEDLKTINKHGSADDGDDDGSLEESHTLKKSATENDH
ncbi:hypothetical protein BGX30_003951, partial [Mortierella sp. GBA39]